jgi:damage-control phosphatase, subfamily I
LKIGAECPLCLLERGCAQLQKSRPEFGVRLDALSKILNAITIHLNPEAVPAYIGTKRDRLIRKITGNLDPYEEEKGRSNRFALDLLPKIVDLLSSKAEGYERFRAACAVAVAGNVLDFNVKGHMFHLDDKLTFFNDLVLELDQTEVFYDLVKNSPRIVFLADNAGEIAFDTLLVREMNRLGPEVIVVVKGKPVLNDATMIDAEIVGMDKIAHLVIDNGSDAVGTILSETSPKFQKVFLAADLVVAKGMGNYETLTELVPVKPVVHLLMAKCDPVARSIGVKKGSRCVFIRSSSR